MFRPLIAVSAALVLGCATQNSNSRAGRVNDASTSELLLMLIQARDSDPRDATYESAIAARLLPLIPTISDPKERALSVRALAGFPTEAVIATLVEFARVDQEPQVRWEALWALGGMGDPDLALTLLPFTLDSSESVRGAADDALARLAPAATADAKREAAARLLRQETGDFTSAIAFWQRLLPKAAGTELFDSLQSDQPDDEPDGEGEAPQPQPQRTAKLSEQAGLPKVRAEVRRLAGLRGIARENQKANDRAEAVARARQTTDTAIRLAESGNWREAEQILNKAGTEVDAGRLPSLRVTIEKLKSADLESGRVLLKSGKLQETTRILDGLAPETANRSDWVEIRKNLVEALHARAMASAKKNDPNSADDDARMIEALGSVDAPLQTAIESTPLRREQARKQALEAALRAKRDRLAERLQSARFIWLPQTKTWVDAYFKAMGGDADPRDWRGKLREEQIQGFLKAREAALPRFRRLVDLNRFTERLAKGDECTAMTERCAVDLGRCETEYEEIRRNLEAWIRAAVEDRQNAMAR